MMTASYLTNANHTHTLRDATTCTIICTSKKLNAKTEKENSSCTHACSHTHIQAHTCTHTKKQQCCVRSSE